MGVSIKAGDMLAKNSIFLAKADAAGLVLGGGAGHFDVARKLGSHANGVLRSRGALGRRSPATAALSAS